MTAQQIRILVRQLFKEGPLRPVYTAAGRRVSADEIELQALKDPGFGGRLVGWFSDAGQPLPNFITNPIWLRANRFLLETGRPDPDVKVAWAYALNLPGSEPQRNLLHAILLCQHMALQKAATLLRIDLEVLTLFESLHFNVLDRKLERPYIARLCGRIALQRGSATYQASDALEQTLLRIAWETGSPEAVLAQAGISPLKDGVLIEKLLEGLRSDHLSSAFCGLALEKTCNKDNPTLKNALKMMAMMKKAKAENKSVISPDISIAESAKLVLEGIRQHSKQSETIK